MQQRQRSGVIMGLMGLSLFVAAAIGSGPAQAATGNGPYYAEPAWAQKLPVATRFIELTDWSSAAVLDRETGLVWEKAPQVTAETWFSARGTCANKTIGNRKGWRLPSVHELASVIDPSQSNPALPLSHPFTNVLPFPYWSATTLAENPTSAWYVNVTNGNVFTTNKADAHRVWCVRGGTNADTY
ncbi:MAG: DUF1566 domain-containing protein [Nitrospira sp.]|nr:DUF1566 domain-containing protein [Nitrospira sp.]